MEVKYINDPFPHAVINNFFTEEELPLIWNELEFLTHGDKLQDETKTGSAWSTDGSLKKKNYGVFVDGLYTKREISNILTITSKVFNQDLMNELYSNHWVFRYLKESTKDNTLLSYYEDSNHYDKHFDYASITMLVHLFKEPKMFEGGDLIFQENYNMPLVNNRAILFPSIIDHEVTKVSMTTNQPMSGYGRYCISKFIQIF